MSVEFLEPERPEPPIAVAAMSRDTVMCTVVPEYDDGSIAAEGITAQTRRVFANLDDVLRKAGSSLEQVMHVTVYLVNIGDRAAMTDVWCQVFQPPYPGRATIGVKELGHPDMLIEITVVAERG
ncbi:MAG TPA: RidA family protein [Actinomycetaceae bacterium]|nr:RidA family protein [Actinomycetaceae bacterium]